MSLFKSSNPTLKDSVFEKVRYDVSSEQMTVSGTLNKFGITLLLMVAAAAYTWKGFYEGANIIPYLFGGIIVGLIAALVIIFKPTWSPYLVPVYALAEGLFLGGISAFFNDAFATKAPGIVMQAVGLTFGVVLAMFLLYRSGIIRATESFKKIVFVATAGIAVFYVIAFVLRFFSIQMPLIHDSTPMGIVFSLIVVAIAAMNLILDFDFIERGSEQGAPKYMEWYGAFGLMVTIVWLYLEILRLLAKLAERK